jgi:hypothetical protein
MSTTSTRSTGTRRSICATVKLIFYLSLGLCILALALLALFAYRYAASAAHSWSHDVLGRMVNASVTLRPPFGVDVVNVTVIPSSSGGAGELEVWVDVYGRVGVDAGAAVDFVFDGETETETKVAPRSFVPRILRSVARWGIRTVGITHISLTLDTIVFRDSNGHKPTFFARVRPASAIELPLAIDPPSSSSEKAEKDKWLSDIHIPLLINPTQNTTAVVQFIQSAWRAGTLSVLADIPSGLTVKPKCGGWSDWDGWSTGGWNGWNGWGTPLVERIAFMSGRVMEVVSVQSQLRFSFFLQS